MTVCKVCEDPLLVELEPDEEESGLGETVPDDLRLPCNCRFHWQCLIDLSPQIVPGLLCPSCRTPLATSTATASSSSSSSSSSSLPQIPPITASYSNEGGDQPELDISPHILEEAYLATNPDARPLHALHVLASEPEGDATALLDLLPDLPDARAALYYRDPLDKARSPLHTAVVAASSPEAVASQNRDVLWLLLWLASALPDSAFPENLKRAAGEYGVGRVIVASVEDDIRSLRDDEGCTAEDLARKGGVLGDFVDSGVLAPPI